MTTSTLNVTNSQSVGITLASVANGATATSSAIDNATNKFPRVTVQLKAKTNAAGTSAQGYCMVWLCRSVDGGTTYDDAGRTLIGQLPMVANATTYEGSWPIDLDCDKWKIAVTNNTGAALDATGGSHSVVFAGIKYDNA